MGEKPNCQKNQNEKKLQKMLLLALLGGRCYPQNKLRPMAMVSVTPVPQCQGIVGCVTEASFFYSMHDPEGADVDVTSSKKIIVTRVEFLDTLY